MILRKSERPTATVENMRGGDGEVFLRHLCTPEKQPGNTRVLAEIVLKPGCSAGAHIHEGEVEVYMVLKGTAVVLDAGEDVSLNEGDVAITDGAAPHALKNQSDADCVVLAVVVLD